MASTTTKDTKKSVSAKNRNRYTPIQKEKLELAFDKSHYPDSETMEDLADDFNVSVEKVSIWFQNRRTKFKRQSKSGHMTWMRQQFFLHDTTASSVSSTSSLSSTSSSSTSSNTDEDEHVITPPKPVKNELVRPWLSPCPTKRTPSRPSSVSTARASTPSYGPFFSTPLGLSTPVSRTLGSPIPFPYLASAMDNPTMNFPPSPWNLPHHSAATLRSPMGYVPYSFGQSLTPTM